VCSSQLNKSFDSEKKRLVVLRDQFLFRSHLCFVFELLSINLYELLKQNQYRGLSLNLIRILLDQCLDALEALATVGVIHCDLKVRIIVITIIKRSISRTLCNGFARPLTHHCCTA